jgi:hypothetical protein
MNTHTIDNAIRHSVQFIRRNTLLVFLGYIAFLGFGISAFWLFPDHPINWLSQPWGFWWRILVAAASLALVRGKK